MTRGLFGLFTTTLFLLVLTLTPPTLGDVAVLVLTLKPQSLEEVDVL